MSKYRELLKHSAMYGIGAILGRLSSLLLLPVYTSYLAPQDYAVIALLDATTSVLTIVMLSGLVQSVTRHHFSTEIYENRRSLWWTALSMMAAVSCVIGIPIFVTAPYLSRIILGSQVTEGPFYIRLVILTLATTCVEVLLQTYLRVRKWSFTVVASSLIRLAFNVMLNVTFLVHGLGIAAILLGNLITSVFASCFLLLVFAYEWRGPKFSRHWVKQLSCYGGPLIVTGLLAFVLHQSDRFFLRFFVPLEDLGLYALGYTFASGVCTLAISPFSAIWDVTKFEVAEKPDALEIYARVFDWFLSGLTVAMLALSLFVRPLLHLLTTPAFWPAADVVPVICVAYLFFSANIFFIIPATTRDMTHRLVPASAVAALTNTVCNIVLIPPFGIYGAAIATVVSFLVLAIINFAVAIKICKIPFPLAKVSGILFCATLIYGSYRLLLAASFPVSVVYVITSVAFILFVATILLRSDLRGAVNVHSLIGRNGKGHPGIHHSVACLTAGSLDDTDLATPLVSATNAASVFTK